MNMDTDKRFFDRYDLCDELYDIFNTGRADLDAAEILKANQKHAHACFNAQQAVEKAINTGYHPGYGIWR